MPTSLASAEPYTRSFEARVEEVLEVADREPYDRGGAGVVLSESYFYPQGGGQPADSGTIAGNEVVDVRLLDGRVVHELSTPLQEGETVAAEVDDAFRTYCMRAHTASHALYGAGRRLFDHLGYGGFEISESKVRVDLATPSDVDDAALVDLERLTNEVVWESRAVSWEQLPRHEALSRENVAFNTKTEEGIEGERVRVVTIEGWDEAACGGTHVRNTREIGAVTVLGRSNPGEGLTRVEVAVGPDAIERRATEKAAALDAARALGTNVADLADAVERLGDERASLADELDDLRAELAAGRVDELPTVERDGLEWRVGTLDLGANDLKEAATDNREGVDVVALVGADGSLAVATNGEADAAAVVDDVTDEFGGGGGGSPTVAQAGGLDADPEEVVAFLRGG
jgi:alanyl-tRNA synthetase